MKPLIVWLLLLMPLQSLATPISIGGTEVVIPNPAGFAPLTPSMAPVYEFQRQLVPPTNEQFLAFIPESGVPAAMQGQVPDLTRTFAVQTAKSIAAVTVTSSDFAELKRTLIAENQSIVRKIEKEIPGLLGKVNSDISQKYDMDLALSMSQMVPLPSHYQTDRILSYSVFVKYAMNDASGSPENAVVAMTTTFVHVRGKVLFLYAYAEDSGLEWTRESSKRWASAIVAANPSNAQSSLRESAPSAISGIDWGKVGAKGIVGAIIGLIVGLIGWLMNRSKSR